MTGQNNTDHSQGVEDVAIEDKKESLLERTIKSMQESKKQRRIKKSRREARRKAKRNAFFDNATKGDALQFYRSVRRKHILYGVASFIMSFMFYSEFSSPEWLVTFFDGYLSPSMAEQSRAYGAIIWMLIGLLFATAITLMIMHSHAVDKRGFSVGKYIMYAFLAFLGLFFNVFTEVASTLDRGEERVNVKSANSPMAKALMKNVGKGSHNNPETAKYIKDIARWQANVDNRCPRYINVTDSNGKVRKRKNANFNKKHCAINTGKLNGVKQAFEIFQQTTKSDAENNIALAKDALHNTEYTQMIVKLLIEWAGKDENGKNRLPFIYALAIISFFIIFVFESLGIMIGVEYARARIFLQKKGVDLHGDLAIGELTKELARKIKADEKRDDFQRAKSRAEIERTKRNAIAQTEITKAKLEASKIIYRAKQEATKELNDFMGGLGLNNVDADGSNVHHAPIGFVDTDAISNILSESSRPIESHVSQQVGSVGSFDQDLGFNSGVDSTPPIDIQLLSYEELLNRRSLAKANHGGIGTCPACSTQYEKDAPQQMYCCPKHTKAFNNYLRKAKKLI